MNYSGYELLWLFFVYSFLGWLIETAVASGKHRKFINRGVFTGPVCFVYGFSAVFMTLAFWELKDNPLFLFLGCMIVATVVEWFTGKALERMNHRKWWDYSGKRWNFDGYICLPYSLLWGILGVFCIYYGNEFFTILYKLLPKLIAGILIWTVLGIGILDAVVSYAAFFHNQKKMPDKVQDFDRELRRWTRRLGEWIFDHMEIRIEKAYPAVGQENSCEEEEEGFADGCGFYKLFWLFFISAFLGDLVETVFCRYSMGRWMSRSSLVWGPFSIVWGLGCMLLTAILYQYRNRSDSFIFVFGTVMGGAYEYICSVFTEIVFGTVFWDYSKIPFNLGGRINLLFCFFWGIAAVIWMKVLYPFISKWIEKIPKKTGIWATWILIVFMVFDIGVTALALNRYTVRQTGEGIHTAADAYMDAHFPDERIESRFPNLRMVEKPVGREIH